MAKAEALFAPPDLLLVDGNNLDLLAGFMGPEGVAAENNLGLQGCKDDAPDELGAFGLDTMLLDLLVLLTLTEGGILAAASGLLDDGV